MKASKLKPRIATLTAGLACIEPTERMRGSMLQKRNRRIFAQEPMCRQCKVRIAREVDHIIPLWAGGADDESNLQPLCFVCHVDKSNAENEAGGRVSRKFTSLGETAAKSFTD